jgi:hypothetical protein
MTASRFATREITCFDRSGRREVLRYSELMLPMGEEREVSLAEYLDDEEQKIWELRRNSRAIGDLIDQLNDLYRLHQVAPEDMLDAWDKRTRGLEAMTHAERLARLNSYYLVPKSDHGRLLDRIMEYMMAGAEDDHSAHELSLIRFGLDFALWSMRNLRRRTGAPGGFHAIESARGVAKNGRGAITIMGALFHDVLEEILDDAADLMCQRVAEEFPDVRARIEGAGKITEDIRLDIIRAHIDDYNNQASGVYYAIGLFLFAHIRRFPFPDRYYQFLNGLMGVVENLSRTKDTSYFSYIQRFVYPKERPPDAIRREDLVAAISEVFPRADAVLTEYLEKVEGFYTTRFGTFRSQEELQRNAFREILCKIVDRLNNTRDLDRHFFSVSKRLYGAGFKNLYIVQAIDEKTRKNQMPSEERRLIDLKFLNKPKVAALYQMLDEIEHLEGEIGKPAVREIEAHLSTTYLHTPAFREVRSGVLAKGSPSKVGRAREPADLPNVDGTIEFFTRAVLGEKNLLGQLDNDLPRATAIAIVFRFLFEAFLAYPVLIEVDAACGVHAPDEESRYEAFRIRGLNKTLEDRVHVATHDAARGLDLRSFRRRIV